MTIASRRYGRAAARADAGQLRTEHPAAAARRRGTSRSRSTGRAPRRAARCPGTGRAAVRDERLHVGRGLPRLALGERDRNDGMSVPGMPLSHDVDDRVERRWRGAACRGGSVRCRRCRRCRGTTRTARRRCVCPAARSVEAARPAPASAPNAAGGRQQRRQPEHADAKRRLMRRIIGGFAPRGQIARAADCAAIVNVTDRRAACSELSASCGGSTVRRSSSTRSCSIRAMTGGVCGAGCVRARRRDSRLSRSRRATSAVRRPARCRRRPRTRRRRRRRASRVDRVDAAASASARTRISSAVIVSMRCTGTVVVARPAAYSTSVASSAA